LPAQVFLTEPRRFPPPLKVDETECVFHCSSAGPLLIIDVRECLPVPVSDDQAATTAEAREVIVRGRPDVALVDFHLRGENSYTLIAQLRQEGIPVIMLSGSIESPAPALLEGVVMLEKPVREEQILEHLRPIARTRQK
jgi:CheY-like chemotaxis protein